MRNWINTGNLLAMAGGALLSTSVPAGVCLMLAGILHNVYEFRDRNGSTDE